MEGKYAANRKEALAFKKELEQIKKKATIDRMVNHPTHEDVVVTADGKRRAQSVCAGAVIGLRPLKLTHGGLRAIRSHDDASNLLQGTNVIPKPPKEPKRKRSGQCQSPRPSQLKVNAQQPPGTELQRKSFVKKEASNKQFAIIGACNTTVPVSLSKRPSPSSRRLLNLPTASAKQLQDDEETSSDITSLPQQLKSRPTTRGSMQTSEGMSKSSFQQYILATADYMRTSSEPFSVTSGSPLGWRAQSQTPSKQTPLRVQSLPEFSSYYVDKEAEQPQTGAQEGSRDSKAQDGSSKRQSRALKLEVDLRVATSLTSIDTHAESSYTQPANREPNCEVPTVNVIESQSALQPHHSYPVQLQHNSDDHCVTVVHSDGIFWSSRDPFAVVPHVDSSSLAVSDTASQSSSTLTLKYDDTKHLQATASYSDSLYDNQSTAERSLLCEQDSSLVSSGHDFLDNQVEVFVGGSSSHVDTIEVGTSHETQTKLDPSFITSEASINILSSGSPSHLPFPSDNASLVMVKSSNMDMFSTAIPTSQQSQEMLSSHQDFLFTPAVNETSLSAPAMLSTTDRTGDYDASSNWPQLTGVDIPQASGSSMNDYETTHMLAPPQLLNSETALLESDASLLENLLIADVQNGSVTMEVTAAHVSDTSVPVVQEVLDSAVPQQTGAMVPPLHQTTDDLVVKHSEPSTVDVKEPVNRAPSVEGHSISGTQIHLASGDLVEVVSVTSTHDIGANKGGQLLSVSEGPTDSTKKPLTPERIMEKLLSNQADDLPTHSLAEFLAYTDKPVTLADIMNIKGESLMPPTPQPEEQVLPESDQPSTGGLVGSRTVVDEVPNDKRPSKSADKKKKVVFLSEWTQEKHVSKQDLALKQLMEPSSRKSIHHFCIVPESPQLPHRLQILSCKTHANPHIEEEISMDQQVSSPSSTPFMEKRLQTDQATVAKPVGTGLDNDSSSPMFVKGTSLSIITDPRRLLWKPSPAKLSLFPSTVKSHLFPDYHGLSSPHSANQNRVSIKLPSEVEGDGHGARNNLRVGPTSLAFRSLIDFSKYSAKDVPDLTPFTKSTDDVISPPSSSSSSSCSGSGTSSSCGTEPIRYTMETVDSDDQTTPVTDTDHVVMSTEADDQDLHQNRKHLERTISQERRNMLRRSTLPQLELLELVSKNLKKEISVLQKQNIAEDDEESITTTTVTDDSGIVEQRCISMPNISLVSVKDGGVDLDHDDFTDTMAELEKQKHHLAEHHGHLKNNEQPIDSDECLSGTTDLDSVYMKDERQMQQRGRRFRPAHTRPGRGGKQRTVRKRTKSALARAYKAKKMLSQPPRNLKRNASIPLFKGNTDSIEVLPPSSDYRRSRRLSDPMYHDFEALAQSYDQRFLTEKDCFKWVDQLWDEWFEEAYAESKAALEMPIEPGASFFSTPKGSKLQVTRDESKNKEQDEGPKMYDLENIEKTVFDDEAEADLMRDKVTQLTKHIEKAHTAETKAIHLCRRGAFLRRLGQFCDAKDDVEKAIALVPRLVEAYWHRHCLFIIQNDTCSAMVDLDTILGLNRRHTKSYRSKALLLKGNGDLKEALFCLSQAVILDRRNKTLYKQRATLYEQKGAIESAVEDYATMVEIDPSDTGAILQMGIHHFNKRMWSAASQNFSLLVQQDASNTTARIYRAQAQWKLGNYVQALQDLSAAIHLDPNNAAAYYHRACLLRVRHPQKALQDYSTSLLLDSSVNNVMAYLHRGILYTSINCYTDAIPDFEAAIKLDSTVACFHVCLGLTYLLHSKQYQKAVNCFTASIKVDPTYVRAYVCRAEAYQQMKKLKKALVDYARASHIQPDESSYLLYKGYLLLLMNKLDLAHAHISTASKMGACLGQETAHKASLDSFLGNHEEAIQELVVAVRSKPSPQMLMLLGRTCQNAGDHTQAVSAFDRAIEATEIHSCAASPPKPELLSQIHFLCGTSHTELGSYQTAIEHLSEALRYVSSNALAYYQRGIAKLKNGNNKGILDLNRALSINPKMFEVFLTRACYYSANGRFTKAILNCNQAIQLQPQSVRAYLYRGSLKYYTNQYKSAIEDLTTAVNLDRQCSLAYFNRALCQQALANTDKAIADYSIVLLIKEEPSYEVLINRGLLYLTIEEYGSALMDLIDAGKLRPKNSSIFQAIGLCYHRLGELQLSIEAYDQAILLDNFFIEAYIGRGNVHMDYLTPGRIVMSKLDYCRAIHFDPCCLPARVNLAHTLQMEEKYLRSWNHFSCALSIDTRYVPALEGRAIVNLQMGNLFGSFLDITSAIRISPTAELYTNRGVIHQFMGKGVDAMKDYEMALKFNSRYGLALFNIGNVYFHHRQFQQAVDAYTKALEVSPNDDSYLLNRGIARSLLKDYDGALDDFNASIDINPGVAHAYFNRGNLYKTYEQYDLAEEDYKIALSLNPDDLVFMNYCSQVLGKQGKTKEALKYFEKQLDPVTRT